MIYHTPASTRMPVILIADADFRIPPPKQFDVCNIVTVAEIKNIVNYRLMLIALELSPFFFLEASIHYVMMLSMKHYIDYTSTD